MEIEYPPILTGTPEEQLRQIREYLCRLADTLHTHTGANALFESDGGTGIALKEQFGALSNKINEIWNEIREIKGENNGES